MKKRVKKNLWGKIMAFAVVNQLSLGLVIWKSMRIFGTVESPLGMGCWGLLLLVNSGVLAYATRPWREHLNGRKEK